MNQSTACTVLKLNKVKFCMIYHDYLKYCVEMSKKIEAEAVTKGRYSVLTLRPDFSTRSVYKIQVKTTGHYMKYTLNTIYPYRKCKFRKQNV